MGNADFRISVDDDEIAKQIRKRIEAGIKESTKKLGKKLTTEAQSKLEHSEATGPYGIWNGDLLDSFKTKRQDGKVIVYTMDEARWGMEKGYGPRPKGPPIEKLLPWVADHFPPDTDFDPWDIGGGDEFIKPPDYEGYKQHFGTTDGADNIDEDLKGWQRDDRAKSFDEIGQFDQVSIINTDGDRRSLLNVEATEIEDSAIIGDDGYRYFDNEFVNVEHSHWLDTAEAEQIEAGDTVWFTHGYTEYKAYVQEVVTSHKPEKLIVDLDGTDERVEIYRRQVTRWEAGDDNPLPDWVGDDWHKFDPDQKVSQDHFYYGGKVAIYHHGNDEWLEAEVTRFIDDGVEVELPSGLTWNVGYENEGQLEVRASQSFDELTRADQEAVLFDYFDEVIRPHSPNLTDARLDYLRDTIFIQFAPKVRDEYVLKGVVEGVNEIDTLAKQNWATGGNTLGRANYKDGFNWVLSVLSESEIQNAKSAGTDPTPYDGTVIHEMIHGVHWTNAYAQGRHSPNDWKDVFKDKFTKSGLSTNAGIGVPHATNLMLGKYSPELKRAPPIGFKRWHEWEYERITTDSYPSTPDPGWDTREGTFPRLIEAANRAAWIQILRGQKYYDETGKLPPNDAKWFVQRRYSGANAAETLTTLTEVLMETRDGNIHYRIEYIDSHYPWLIEAWLNEFEPSEFVKDTLRRHGYNV